MRKTKWVSLLFMFLTVLCSLQIVNAGEALPLKHGLYVTEGAKCPESNWSSDFDNSNYYIYNSKLFRQNSGSSFYDGNGTCEITKVSQKGNLYTTAVECLYHGAPEPDQWELVIKNNISFTKLHDKDEQKLTHKKGTVYNFCAESIVESLPDWERRMHKEKSK
jgi:hypothetical protein